MKRVSTRTAFAALAAIAAVVAAGAAAAQPQPGQVRAAFFAADKKTAVNMKLLERAARLELEAQGKLAF